MEKTELKNAFKRLVDRCNEKPDGRLAVLDELRKLLGLPTSAELTAAMGAVKKPIVTVSDCPREGCDL